jgi:hypothetical protein
MLAIIAGMTTGVTGFIACDCAADRVRCPAASCRHRPLTGRAASVRWASARGSKSRRHVVAFGELDASLTATALK